MTLITFPTISSRIRFLLIEVGQQEVLRKGNVAGRKFLRQMQKETTLHLENDMGKPFRIGTNLSCFPFLDRRSCPHKSADKLKWRENVSNAPFSIFLFNPRFRP